jgi:hypothetical protein
MTPPVPGRKVVALRGLGAWLAENSFGAIESYAARQHCDVAGWSDSRVEPFPVVHVCVCDRPRGVGGVGLVAAIEWE